MTRAREPDLNFLSFDQTFTEIFPDNSNCFSFPCRIRVTGFYIDCKTVRIFAYLSTGEQSNKRSGTRLKTESETSHALRACEAHPLRARKTLTQRFTDFIELDMSTGLDFSIPSSRPLTFPGGQSKNGYRAR